MVMSPTVLYPLTLVGLIHHILQTQSGTATTTLVICSSRDAFVRQLSQSLQDNSQDDHEDQNGRLQNLATPTLHNLLTTRHIKLAFCASVQTLLAYLTAYGRDASLDAVGPVMGARMILVNPLSLHASTLSFSAQGLSRTFSAATETALKSGTALHVVECQNGSRLAEQREGEDVDMDDVNEENTAGEDAEQDPWETEVSILNVSARRFGSNSGERAWAGRTVKAKRIAARWFRFQQLHEEQNSH
ncbi:hypothetical protein DE146DRAFT_68846 [Phaeosphaeria sp. MPI-PUGE-AT-0046c]|nr:hypothetical protein DE146DRAFT_68846 [Phaeosphaeria sp. MPI-PUGE-AT-0046c]